LGFDVGVGAIDAEAGHFRGAGDLLANTGVPSLADDVFR